MTDMTWTPTQLGNAVVAWWDASDATTLTMANNVVSKWASKAGGIYASAAANAPIYNPTARNSMPGIVFDGKSFLNINSVAGLPSGANPSTIIMVSYMSAKGNYPCAFNYGARNSAQQRAIIGASQQGFLSTSICNNDFSSGVQWVGSDKIAIASFISLTSSSLAIDGNAATNFTTGKMNTVLTTGNIGAQQNGSYNFSGTVQEIIVINRILTADEKAEMEGYLAWKWNIEANLPVSHPYKNKTSVVPVASSFSQYAPAEAAGYKMTFSEDFTSAISIRDENPNAKTGTWSQYYWYGWPGYYSCHDDYAQNSMVSVAWSGDEMHVQDGNTMKLMARAKPITGTAAKYGTRKYLGSIIQTNGSFSQKYGYWETRFRCSTLPGSWPCFWLWSLTNNGEIDVAEFNTTEQGACYMSYHQRTVPDGKGGYTACKQIDSTVGVDATKISGYKIADWHTYGFLWTAEKMVWLIDGVVCRTVTGHQYHEAAFAIFTNGAGGWNTANATPSTLPIEFEIDYLKVGLPA